MDTNNIDRIADLMEIDIERVAEIAHEANRCYCQLLGDNSQPSWHNAPDWQKKSAILGVKTVLANPKISPKEQHEIWMGYKLADGWHYWPVKNIADKGHPCLLPYEQLSEDQKIKDIIFGAAVRAMAGLEWR